jgi:uncharacterized pyridoxamine 5'-phosphate oxidase family protein
MTKDEIHGFLKENPVCFLATVDGDQARVRGMMLYVSDAGDIIFHLGDPKDVTAQLRANPKLELCALSKDGKTQVRVTGAAEFVDDRALRKEIVTARPFLDAMEAQMGAGWLVLLRVKNPIATVWTMERNLDAKAFIQL